MQISDNFDYRTMTEIGRFLGAEYLISIIADGQGGLTRLRMRVLNTQTAMVAGSASIPFTIGNIQTSKPENMARAVETAVEQAIGENLKGSVIGIVQIIAPTSAGRDFVAGETEYLLLNKGFQIVDRSQLDKIRAERNFQRTGEVDDNTAVALGREAGARYIITGRVDGQGSLARVRLRVLDTHTAEVVGASSGIVHQRFSMRDGERTLPSLDRAIETAITQVKPNIPPNSVIAIVQVTGANNEFVTGELEALIAKQGFNIVDRARLNLVRNEQRIAQTTEFDNATAVTIGKIAGAAYIITNIPKR